MGRCTLIAHHDGNGVPTVDDKPTSGAGRRPLTLAELRLLADACVTEFPQLLRYYTDRQILESWRRLAETHNLVVDGVRRGR